MTLVKYKHITFSSQQLDHFGLHPSEDVLLVGDAVGFASLPHANSSAQVLRITRKSKAPLPPENIVSRDGGDYDVDLFVGSYG